MIPGRSPQYSYSQTKNLSDLYLGQRIQELFEVPTSLEFLRDYVAKNVPVIIRSGTLDWPAITKWNSHYFRCVVTRILHTFHEDVY